MSLIVLVAMAVFLSPGGAAQADQQRWDQPRKISKIYFMYHPVCWAILADEAQPPARMNPEQKLAWLYAFEREKQVNKLQKQFMDRMKPDEALVMFPISRAPVMVDLERHGTSVLGRRCIISRLAAWDVPEAWYKLPNKIQQFLDTPDLEGKEQFLKNVPPEIQKELENEIRDACKTIGYNWSVSAFDVMYYQRMAAEEILKEFKYRGLVFDPKTVKCEAFGEGFEECAMTWRTMLPPYMGINGPAHNIYDLSVTGTKLLFGSKFKERIELEKDIALYLWEGADGRPIGMFARGICRLKDPQYFTEIAWKGAEPDVWMMNYHYFPPNSKLIQLDKGVLRVAVHNGIRRDHDKDNDGVYYITARLPYKEFRDRLVKAKIVPWEL